MLESQAYVNPAFCQQSEFLNNNNSSTPNNNNNHNVRETVSDNEFKIRDDQEEELIIDGRFSPRKFDGVVYAIGNGKVEFSKSPISGGSYHMLKPVTNIHINPNNTTTNNGHRYEYIEGDTDDIYSNNIVKNEPLVEKSEPKLILNVNPNRLSNPEATRKLYEILNTPPVRKKPKIVQKLNFDNETPQGVQTIAKNTAVITPIRPTIVFRDEPKSPELKPVKSGSVTAASLLMTVCGILTSSLCLYMFTVVGRMYYLDFSLMSGLACLTLGILGFKSRKLVKSPHRNYISGYVVLSTFSLITCIGLLILLIEQPKPGSPLADITSGAVCGISGISIILASAGSMISYCCQHPPLDTRVQCSL